MFLILVSNGEGGVVRIENDDQVKNDKTKKNSWFYDQKIIGYKNHRVKNLQMIFLVHFRV